MRLSGLSLSLALSPSVLVMTACEDPLAVPEADEDSELRQYVPNNCPATLTVPTNSATLPAALSAVCPGGTILVNPGTYYGTLNITKSVTIKAANPNTALPVIANFLFPNQLPPSALVTVSGGVKVTLTDMKLKPAQTRGVLGVKTTIGPTLTLDGSQVTGGTTGVSGNFRRFMAIDSTFSGSSQTCVNVQSDTFTGSSVSISHSVVSGCGQSGIVGNSFQEADYLANTVSNIPNGTGIASLNTLSGDLSLTFNDVSKSAIGVLGLSAYHGSISFNSIAQSKNTDLSVHDSTGLLIASNTSDWSMGRGFDIQSSDSLDIEGNQISYAAGAGISVAEGHDIDLEYNHVVGGHRSVFITASHGVTMFGDVIEGGSGFGLALYGVSDFTAAHLDVSAIQPSPDTTFGDGIYVDSSTASFDHCNIEYIDRAGISAFHDSAVTVNNSKITCAAILLDEESGSQYVGSSGTCEDCEGNTIPCETVSGSLEPPSSLPVLQSKPNP